MRKISLLIMLLECIVTPADPQQQVPRLLIRAASCLEIKGNFPISKANERIFDYVVDEKSYPGERVMYVVNYAGPERSDGLVFSIFLTQRNGLQVFNIQNNARFTLSRDGIDGISFTDPPLGGTWTQEHLASAIKEIKKQPKYTIPIKAFLAPDKSIRCESYTDPRR